MNNGPGTPAAAPHLDELDARYEAHVAEVRRRAERAKAALQGSAANLRPAPPPEEPAADAGAPLLPDAPLGVDDDGIPLWDDNRR